MGVGVMGVWGGRSDGCVWGGRSDGGVAGQVDICANCKPNNVKWSMLLYQKCGCILQMMHTSTHLPYLPQPALSYPSPSPSPVPRISHLLSPFWSPILLTFTHCLTPCPIPSAPPPLPRPRHSAHQCCQQTSPGLPAGGEGERDHC